jgi:hypothetical protein
MRTEKSRTKTPKRPEEIWHLLSRSSAEMRAGRYIACTEIFVIRDETIAVEAPQDPSTSTWA